MEADPEAWGMRLNMASLRDPGWGLTRRGVPEQGSAPLVPTRALCCGLVGLLSVPYRAMLPLTGCCGISLSPC